MKALHVSQLRWQLSVVNARNFWLALKQQLVTLLSAMARTGHK